MSPTPTLPLMSISVDDLTASLSSSHIGQEAIELAALQAQLAETLFGQSISQPSRERPVTRKSSLTQPCNTPIISSSFTWAHVAELHRQCASSQNVDKSLLDNRDEADDKQMVEASLMSSSPLPQPLLSSPSDTVLQFTSQPCCAIPESCSSHSASTDPFYISQSEAARNCNARSHTVSGLPCQQPASVMQELLPHRREIHS